MKKILVTGCSGYIGSHLCKLLDGNYEVHGLDIQPVKYPVSNFIQHDIRLPIQITDEYDCVIHLAALARVGESEKKPIDYYITNVNGTINVINQIKTKNFIFASTGAAEHCCSPYGISKRIAEDIITEYYTVHYPIDFSLFRFYNIIGSSGFPSTNPDGLMYNLVKAIDTGTFTIFGNDYETPDGTCIRDYVHVNELCKAIETAIEEPSNSLECLGHGIGTSVKEIVELFKEVNDCDFDIQYEAKRKGDIPVSVLNKPSSYMKNLFTIKELLTVDNK